MSRGRSRRFLAITLIWLLTAGALAIGYKFWFIAPSPGLQGPPTTTQGPTSRSPATSPTPTSPTTSPGAATPTGSAAADPTEAIVREFESAWNEALKACGDAPPLDRFVQRAPREAQDRLREKLKAVISYPPRISLALDPFVGNCVLRSPEFKENVVQKKGVYLHLVDDRANSKQRFENLKTDQPALAVFPLEALLTSSTSLDPPPAAIVLIIDEPAGTGATIGDHATRVHVLAANRELLSNPSDKLNKIVQAYLETSLQLDDRMARVVEADARALNRNPADVEKEARGIWWPNTRENYAHFGLLPPAERQGLQLLDDVAKSRAGLLGAEPLKKLEQSADFKDPRPIRPAPVLSAAPSKGEWDGLKKVDGPTLEAVQFGRGKTEISKQIKMDLDAVEAALKINPSYYLLIRGHMSQKGNEDADVEKKNREAATERAEAIKQELIGRTIDMNRLKTTVVAAVEEDENQVSFVLFQQPEK